MTRDDERFLREHDELHQRQQARLVLLAVMLGLLFLAALMMVALAFRS